MKKRYLLKCESYQIYKGKMWFVSGNFLCCRNIFTGVTSLETYIIPQYGSEGSFLCTLTERYDSRMICIPETADRIVDYDVNSKERREIILPKGQYNNGIKFRSSILINNKIYIMPESAHQIIIYEPETGKVGYYSEWIDDILKEHGSYIYEEKNTFSLSRKIGGKIYFSTTFSNQLCCFDPQKGDINCIQIGPSGYRYQLFYYLNGVFYLIDNIKQRIVRWSEDYGLIGQKKGISFNVNLPERLGIGEEAYRFFDAFSIGENIYLPACFAEKSLMIDVRAGKVKECDFLSNVHGCCFAGKVDQTHIIVTSALDNKIFIVDKNLNVNEIILEFVEDIGKVGCLCCFSVPFQDDSEKESHIWHENQEVTLDGFIRYIQ